MEQSETKRGKIVRKSFAHKVQISSLVSFIAFTLSIVCEKDLQNAFILLLLCCTWKMHLRVDGKGHIFFSTDGDDFIVVGDPFSSCPIFLFGAQAAGNIDLHEKYQIRQVTKKNVSLQIISSA